MKLFFFTGPNCGLCDLAMDELNKSEAFKQVHLVKRNIRDDSELYHRYAVRIPVIKREDTGAELGWPFSHTDIEEFLR